jgi:hypothetical protein
MANTIRIKRRATGDAVAPSSLQNAELAFNEVNNTMYYGKGTGGAGGTATNVIAIGGDVAFVSLSGTQTISGNKTFSGTLALGSSATATTQTAGNNSTAVATTAYVDTAVLNATYTFNLAGDTGSLTVDDDETVNISGGTGLTSSAALNSGINTITINLDNTNVTAGSYGTSTAVGAFTVDAQGRLTAASDTNIRTATATDTGLASFNSTDFTVTSGAVTLNAERVEDIVGAMVSSNTESGIAVSYDDDSGKLNFDVNDPTITISGDADGSATMTNLGSTTIEVTLDTVNSNTGSFGSATAIPVVTVNGKGLVTAVTTASISTTLTVGADTGTADSVALASDTLTFSGGEGIDTVVTNNTITISGEDASTSNKGVASFNSDSFSVSSGAVSIKSSGITNSQLVNSTITLGSSTLTLGSATTSVAGITELTVDNINFNGNTITSTDSNGDLVLSPNGTGRVDVSGSVITGVAEPVNATDAATKGYVDTVAEGLHVHQAANCATTNTLAVLSGGTVTYNNGTAGVGATLTLSDALSTIDGYTLNNGDRILVKNETTQAHNGLYTRTSATVLTRSNDFDTEAEIAGGDFVFVENGTIFGNTGFVQTFEVLTVGTDTVIFQQFSGTGTFTAGNGLTIAGTEFNVGGTLDRITVGPDSVDIASNYVGQSSITTLGTIATGTWQGTIISPTYGGTGVNNGTSTITLGGNLVTSGTFATTITSTANTSVTLPVTGTLATLAGEETLTNKTINSSNIGVSNPGTASFTSLTANGATTLTANTTSSSYSTGTLVVTGGIGISGALYGNTSTLSGFVIDGGTF